MTTTWRKASWDFWAIAACTVAGAGALSLVASGNDADSVWPAALFGALIGFVVSVVVVGGLIGGRTFRLRRQVPIAPEAVRAQAERWFGRAPWVLTRNDPNQLVYWRRTEPVAGVVLLLLFAGVVPGILYYFWARGTQTVAIGVGPAPGGAEIEIVVHPQREDGRNRAVDFFNSLHGLVGGGRTP